MNALTLLVSLSLALITPEPELGPAVGPAPGPAEAAAHPGPRDEGPGDASQDENTDEPSRRALLVGIQAYPAETNWTPLAGPHADVEAMRRALIDRASFREENIRVLLDQQATRAGVLAAFDEMIDEAGRGDLILFYFSGHGSQMSDDDGDEASDGLDESLVPYDAFTREGRRNDIRDDEIEKRIARANQKTDQVVLVFDCCNSGRVDRSGTRYRFVPPEVTEETAARKAQGGTGTVASGTDPTEKGFAGKRDSRSSTTRELAPAEPRFANTLVFPKSLRYVSLGACRSYENAAELAIQGEEGAPQIRGVFTYSLVQQLYRMRPGWSYFDLMDEVRARVHEHYRRQRPVIVGPLANEPLFAGGAVATRPHFTLAPDPDDPDRKALLLRGGLAHGIREGAVFDVHPSGATGDDEATLLGQFSVVRARATTSDIRWVSRTPALDERLAAPDSRRFRAFENAAGSGEATLLIALDPGQPSGSEEDDAERKAMADEIRTAIENDPDLALAGAERAHLVVACESGPDGPLLQLRTPRGLALPVREYAGGDIALFAEKLSALGQRHRVTSIRKPTSRRLDVTAKVLLVDDEGLPIGEPERDPSTGVLRIRPGQEFACVLENHSALPVHTALVVISPDGGIAQPWSTSIDEPIHPDQTAKSDIYHLVIPRGAEPFYDHENERFRFIVALEPIDYSAFAQSPVTSMARTRGFSIESQRPAHAERLEDAFLTIDIEIEVDA